MISWEAMVLSRAIIITGTDLTVRLYLALSEEAGRGGGGPVSRWRKWGLYVLYTESIHEDLNIEIINIER